MNTENKDQLTVFCDENHEYKDETGNFYLGVTESLQLVGLTYFPPKSKRTKKLQTALDNGTEVHKTTEVFDSSGVVLPEHKKHEELMKKYDAVLKAEKLEVIPEYIELQLNYSSEKLKQATKGEYHGFAGTVDRVFNQQGNLALIDIKTGKSHKTPNKAYKAQLGGYITLFQRNTKQNIKKCGILWLNDENSYISWVDVQECLNLFRQVLVAIAGNKTWKEVEKGEQLQLGTFLFENYKVLMQRKEEIENKLKEVKAEIEKFGNKKDISTPAGMIRYIKPTESKRVDTKLIKKEFGEDSKYFTKSKKKGYYKYPKIEFGGNDGSLYKHERIS